MISIVLYLRTRPALNVGPLYELMCDMTSASGSEPDKPILVGAKDSMPEDMLIEGRNAHQETFDFVDLAHHGTPLLALRSAMQRACGQAIYVLDDVAQITKATYRNLLGGATFPVKSAGATYVRHPWANSEKPRPKSLGLREYNGPLAFPFALRQEARLKAGAMPPVTRSEVEDGLVAYSVALRSAGYWIAGSLETT